MTATSGLTEDEIKKMIDQNKDYMVEVRSGQEFDKARHQAEKSLEEIQSCLRRSPTSSRAPISGRTR